MIKKRKQFEHPVYGCRQTIHTQRKLPMIPKSDKMLDSIHVNNN